MCSSITPFRDAQHNIEAACGCLRRLCGHGLDGAEAAEGVRGHLTKALNDLHDAGHEVREGNEMRGGTEAPTFTEIEVWREAAEAERALRETAAPFLEDPLRASDAERSALERCLPSRFAAQLASDDLTVREMEQAF